MSNASTSIPICLTAFCNLKVDVIVESDLGLRIGAHKSTLYSFNSEFPRPAWNATRIQDIEVIKIEEPWNILILLLHFSHRLQNHAVGPELCRQGVDTLMKLADAAKKYENKYALEACRWPIMYHARSNPETALRLMRCILDIEDTNPSPTPDIEGLVQSTMVLPADTVKNHFSIHDSRHFMIYTIYRDKWKSVLEEYHQVIDDCAYLHASAAKHPIRQVARFIQGALWRDKTPSLAAVDTVFRDAKSRFPKSNTFLLSPWIRDIKSTLEKLPKWEEVRRNVLYGITS